MSEKEFHLLILTPYGRYFEGDVSFLNVFSEKYNLGIYAGHAELISTVDICKMTIRIQNREYIDAVGGGAIKIGKDKITLLLNSVERNDEIDIERAKEAKKRAEDRLNSENKQEIDVNRAKLALLRAVNRINIGEN